MDRLIEQQIFALDMDVVTNRMQCLQIEDKVITLLNELWDQMCINTTARCTVEIACEENGMEFTVGELMVPIFYFMRYTTSPKVMDPASFCNFLKPK